jgi:hypothetical protein
MKVLEVRKNQKVRISKEHCATNNTYKRHFFKQIKGVCKEYKEEFGANL